MCILSMQKDAEESLAEALPALEAARIALQDLDKSDVTEIRWVGFLHFDFPVIYYKDILLVKFFGE